jgi:hypothetical protein
MTDLAILPPLLPSGDLFDYASHRELSKIKMYPKVLSSVRPNHSAFALANGNLGSTSKSASIGRSIYTA